MSKGICIFIFCTVFLFGCAHTEYKSYEERDNSSINLSRTVNFYVNPALRDDPPNCVLVLPPPGNNKSVFAHRLERALVRNLTDRFPRVIGGAVRDAKAVNLAFDMAIPVDRRAFAQALDCDTVIEYRILQPQHAYMLFWSEIRIGLEVRLARQRDGLELWKARHIARRSDGGVSFSPFGLAVNAYDANTFSSDADIVESVTEDLVRRLMRSMETRENIY